jgi:outer membrane usher protein
MWRLVSRRQGRSYPHLFIILAFSLTAGIAIHAENAMAFQSDAGDSTQLLEVSVNNWPLQLVAAFHTEGDRIWISADEFAGLGFKASDDLITHDRRVYLDSVPGLRWQIDLRRQTIDITAPFERLTPQPISIQPRIPRVRAQSDWGGLLSYDLYVSSNQRETSGDNSLTVSANFEARLFSPTFIASTTAAMSSTDGDATFIRLDSRIDFDNPERSWRLVIGDTTSAGPDWVRPFRFGGVQWTTDRSLRPDLVYAPVTVLTQNIGVPSSVDLYVDGVQRYSQALDPGAYRLNDLPVLDGENRLRLVVTDPAGRQTEMVLPLYTAPDLLAAGTQAFSLEGGLARQNYASASNDYDGAFVSGSLARGLSDHLTLTGAASFASDFANLGVSAAFTAGHFGAIEGAVLASSSSDGQGLQYLASLQRKARHLNFSLQYLRADDRYRDLASLFGYSRLRQQIAATLGFGLGHLGRIDFAYMVENRFDAPRSEVSTLTYGADLFRRRVHFTASAYTEARSNDWGVSVGVSLPLGRHADAYVENIQQPQTELNTVNIRGSAFNDRLDWQVEGIEGTISGGYAQLDWEGPHVDLRSRINKLGDTTTYIAEVAQSLIWMDGQAFVANHVDDAFTVVDVNGLKGIGVALENRPAGRTNGRGRLFVNGLQSYAPNGLSIEPSDLPLDVSIPDTNRLVAPRRGSGMITRFEAVQARSAIVVLHLPDGKPPPLGANVTYAGQTGEPALVGYDGEVFLAGLPAGDIRLDVTWPHGQCAAAFHVVSATGSLNRLGPFTCAP